MKSALNQQSGHSTEPLSKEAAQDIKLVLGGGATTARKRQYEGEQRARGGTLDVMAQDNVDSMVGIMQQVNSFVQRQYERYSDAGVAY